MWLVAAVVDSTGLEVTEIHRGPGNPQETRGAEEHAARHHEETRQRLHVEKSTGQ